MRVLAILVVCIAALVATAAEEIYVVVDTCVFCDDGDGVFEYGVDLPLGGVVVVTTSPDGTEHRRTTDANGIALYHFTDEAGTYTQTLDESTLPIGFSYCVPASGEFVQEVAYGGGIKTIWLLKCEEDEEEACWLTGGGVKFDQTTNGTLAEHGPDNSMGGNVFPSCDPDPGNGGNWNHVAHGAKLHFQGTDIFAVRCGNVEGIEPGSESPVTPFNFLECWGTGKLKGIKGNKVSYDLVHFFMRCEDRNEPGSHGAKDGADVDRYYLHVYSDPTDPAGSTLLLINTTDDPNDVDPVTITGGNLQLHVSSCDDPPSDAFYANQTKPGNRKK